MTVGKAALACFLFLIPFSIAATEIGFGILLIVWLLHRKHPRFSGSNRKILLLLGFYVAVCAASVVTSSFQKISLIGFIGKTLEHALLFVIAADLVDQPNAARRAIQALLLGGALVVLYGLLQEWTIVRTQWIRQAMAADPIRGIILEYARMVGPYRNPNDLATFLMFAGLIAIGWILRPDAAGNSRALWILPLSLIGCLIWTQSLGAMLGLFGGGLLLAFLHREKKKLLWGIGGLLAVSAVLFLILSPDHFQEILALPDWTKKERISMWSTAWAMISDRPILGHGLNTFMANYTRYAADAGQNPAYAHNCFLQIAAETGLVGLAAFLLLLAGLARWIWRAVRVTPSREESPVLRAALEGIAAALLAFLIQSVFDTNLYALRQAILFWTWAGVAVGISTRLLRSEAAA